MSAKRYAPEFKIEAVKQVLEMGRPVCEVAERLGIGEQSLYVWVREAKRLRKANVAPEQALPAESAEVRRLRAELRRVTEERDILKKAAAYFAKG